MDQREDTMKMSFDNFQIQKWMLQTVRAQKVDENNGVTFLVSFSPSWVTAPKLPKIVSLLWFFCWCQQEICGYTSVKPICNWKFSFCSIRKWYWLLCYDLEFGRYSCLKLMSFVKFLPSQHFSWYFNPQYLVSCCSDPYKTYYFLKEHNEVFQMNINRLLTYIDYLLKSTQSCKKCTIFRNLRTITQEEKKESRNMTPFFSSTFWVLGSLHRQKLFQRI